MRDELNQIIAGIGDSPTGNLIQAAFFHLRTSQSASGTPQKAEFVHKETEVGLIFEMKPLKKENLFFYRFF